MNQSANEVRCIKAMGDAVADLLIATVRLKAAGDFIGADLANAAARKLLDDCQGACDCVLSRGSSRVILLIKRLLEGAA